MFFETGQVGVVWTVDYIKFSKFTKSFSGSVRSLGKIKLKVKVQNISDHLTGLGLGWNYIKFKQKSVSLIPLV